MEAITEASSTTPGDPVDELVDKWGYTEIMPENEVQWPEIPYWVHVSIGVALIVQGLPGTVVQSMALSTNLRCRRAMWDPSGIVQINFIVTNLLLSVLQYPFFAVSSLSGRWLFGDAGCQVYAALGFAFGISSVHSFGLIILDLYLMTSSSWLREKSTLQRGRYYFLFIFLQWQLSLLVIAPPLFGALGRFYYEPFKTACTVDFWHRGYKNYPAYIITLTIFVYTIPMVAMFGMLYKSIRTIRKVDTANAGKSTDKDVLQFAGQAKFCCIGMTLAGVLWMPYAVLCLYTTIFDPSTLNVYVTYVPSLVAKCAPFLNGICLQKFIPRQEVAIKYLKKETNGIPDEILKPLRPLGYKQEE